MITENLIENLPDGSGKRALEPIEQKLAEAQQKLEELKVRAEGGDQDALREAEILRRLVQKLTEDMGRINAGGLGGS